MIRIMVLSAAMLLVGISALFAQQDPNDPGLPDSLIFGSVAADSSEQFQIIDVPVYAVTDDSVGFYIMNMRWRTPRGGVAGIGIEYFYPLTEWDLRSDTVLTEDSSILALGFYDMPGGHENPPLMFTFYARHNPMSYRFAISPNAPIQTVTLDTMRAETFPGARFTSWVPRFQPGQISIGPLQGVVDDPRTPVNFTSGQNYPNPFNASTTIEFALPYGGPVRLEVFDLLGRQVATLIDGIREAGEDEVVWEADELQSGIYFYRLTAGRFVETRRMLLVK